jgi:rhamnogalacturonan hydrolase
MMIKSNGGSGSVSNVLFQDFISRGTAYGLYLNQYWSSQSVGSGDGVKLSNIKFVVSPGPCFIVVRRSRKPTMVHY